MKTTFFNPGIALLWFCILVSGCTQSVGQTTDNVTAATVNGAPLSRQLFDTWIKNRSKVPIGELSKEQKDEMLEKVIALKVAAMAAAKEGLDNDPEIKAQLEIQRMGVLGQNYMNRYLASHPVTEQELKAEYDNQVVAMPGTEFKARHILVESEEEAANLITQLQAGGDFSELAKNNSTGPSAKDGGDLGWFTPDRMVKPFADGLRALKKGEYSPAPVQTQYGWHVILLENTRDTAAPPFEQVKDNLRAAMEQRRLEQKIQKLRQDADVEKTI